MIIDSHAHLYDEYYSDPSKVYLDSISKGLDIIISDGVDHKTNVEMLDKASRLKRLYITLGIHPENTNYCESDIDFIEANLSNKKVIAIGEIGLDYHYEGFDKDAQIDLFRKQLALAEKYNMPVVVHSRDATMDTLNIIKEYKVTGVIHSFSGSKEIALEYIKLGFVLGVNGVVTFKNSKYKEIIREVGIKNYILETDCPYLTPEPNRGKKNYPYYVLNVAKFLSDYLDISVDEIINITSKNVYRIFNKISMQ